MIELSQVVGSILKDISQARFSSDVYSRNISRYYEQDPLLRKFPTPRAEIEEVNIDLKFSIIGMFFDPSKTEGRETSSSTVFERISSQIAAAYVKVICDSVQKYPDIQEDIKNYVPLTRNRIYAQQQVLRYFQNNLGGLFQKGQFNFSEASENIVKILEDLLENILEKAGGVSDEELKRVKEDFRAVINVMDHLKQYEKSLGTAWSSEGDYKVSVEVAADKLQNLPENLISTVRIKATVQNYSWNEIEHEGETWRSLNRD